MIHFKNHNITASGFSLIEVMIAIIMLGMLMTAILNLQNTSFGSIVTSSSKLTHVLSLRNNFIIASLQRAKQQEEPTKKATTEAAEVTFSTGPINEHSSLKKFSNTIIEKAQAQWQHGIIKLQEKMITFLYKAPQKEEQKKK